MRAGALDRVIDIQRSTESVNGLGQVVTGWSTIATMRAQKVEASTAEFMRAFGASTETAIVFRIRFLDGVTLADRVSYEGAAFNLIEVKEIGRRKGLELRCTRIGP
ncbi:phage head closure protein [Ancylobacter vacuolatus]|uniref:SPP1 family predicted phage head-tail adaptor n=1 Tax=Ancylobacter vacuolatus TaxID=223389 RepID=A0ABU0DHF8_9HYPH|nr:phage head closure protein [Ancylobacter vacuolatus]MDQ0347864.1 SPP1 family predicted phage head-tail adaptor [Ancylobacter vacuolatus]